MKEPVAVAARIAVPSIVPIDDTTLHLIDLALEEDRGPGDWTTRWTVPARTRAQAQIVAKAAGVVAGAGVAASVFLRLEPRVEWEINVPDGERVEPGTVICTLRGPARSLLTGERTALNFLQRLSGIATLTRRYVDAVAGTRCAIIDTRKTTPGWRTLEKAAVLAGGGRNHRAGLYDMVLIKDNHKAIAGGLEAAMTLVREQNTRGLPVCVEVHTEEEVEAALASGANRLLLDNMGTAEMAKIARRARHANPRPELEASGNMTLERVAEVAAAGVDFISVGALTHSAPALDVSMRLGRP